MVSIVTLTERHTQNHERLHRSNMASVHQSEFLAEKHDGRSLQWHPHGGPGLLHGVLQHGVCGGRAAERLHLEGFPVRPSADQQQRRRLPEEPGGGRLLHQPLPPAEGRPPGQQLRPPPARLLHLRRLRLLPQHVRQHPVHGLHRSQQVPEDRPSSGDSHPADHANGPPGFRGNLGFPRRRHDDLHPAVAAHPAGRLAQRSQHADLRRPAQQTDTHVLQGVPLLHGRHLPARPHLAALLLPQHHPQAEAGAATAAGVPGVPQTGPVSQEPAGAGGRVLRVLRAIPPDSAAVRLPPGPGVRQQPGAAPPEGADHPAVGPQRLPGPAHLLLLLQDLQGAAGPAGGAQQQPGGRSQRRVEEQQQAAERRPSGPQDVGGTGEAERRAADGHYAVTLSRQQGQREGKGQRQSDRSKSNMTPDGPIRGAPEFKQRIIPGSGDLCLEVIRGVF